VDAESRQRRTTGGNQPGDRFTEAEASTTTSSSGRAGDVDRLENTSRNTYDALAGVASSCPRARTC
jgi:hypothetical protein